ncbi:TIGR02391 family protein [Pseudomonas sp. MF6747]|uniref:TIGR02391 family protein n=1 Tax=Pseudomonas sp. MF6747 TaxID=2797527 RepID=UPI001F196D3B|nr:TIGR02391 family protein [Pseudomonas sp. MF6747]
MSLNLFEEIVRRTKEVVDGGSDAKNIALHPFELRNIHQSFYGKVKKLFDNGHCAESTFEAFKLIDKLVQRLCQVDESGFKLMMNAFNETKPMLTLADLSTTSGRDEQKGYSFLFSGAVMAIRNPRGHEINLSDDPDTCLDHLAFASLLLRRLEQSGFS